MQAPYNDRWERTKRYLFRNFLVNPGFQLSPIPEEDRSSPDSDGSLPELVVEREPNRHDDNDEFYDGLERRMRRYYRQLFLGENPGDDEDSSEFEVNRSMTSTLLIENEHEEKTAEAEETNTDSIQDVSAINERPLRFSTNELQADDANETYEVEHNQTFLERYQDQESVDDEEGENYELTKTPSGIFKIVTDTTVNAPTRSEEDNHAVQDSHSNRSSFYKSRIELDHSLDLNDVGDRRSVESASETIQSKSDTEDSTPCHRISTTVAEIHNTSPIARMSSTREFNDGSPVLVPRMIRFGRSIFGPRIRDLGQSVSNIDKAESSGEIIGDLSQNTHEFDENVTNKEENTDNRENRTINIVEEAENYEEDNIDKESKRVDNETDMINIDEDIESVEEESDTIGVTEDSEDATVNVEEETESIEEETEVQRLLTANDITNVSQDTDESPDLNAPLNDDGTNENTGNNDDLRSEHGSEYHSGVSYNQSRSGVESIGRDEFNYTARDDKGKTDDHSLIGWEDEMNDDDNSIEHALRKGVFQSKNKKKTFARSSDDELDGYTDEYVEPVEEMRGARDASAKVSLIRKSEGTEDSPVPAFETNANADQLEEVSSDFDEINAQESEQEEFIEPRHTPTRPTTTAVDDFWSVSPIQVDIEESPNSSGSLKRKSETEDAPMSKRSCKDVATQASSGGTSWEDIKANIFVGPPVVLRLCGCQDHVCS